MKLLVTFTHVLSLHTERMFSKHKQKTTFCHRECEKASLRVLPPLVIRRGRRHDNCQQKNSGIQRKDLMAVPAAMPASSPKAMFSIKPSKGSL